MSTFERRCVTKNEPTGSVEVAVVDEEAVAEVLVEVEEGREVEGEESDRRQSVFAWIVRHALGFFYSDFRSVLVASGSFEPVYMVTADYD